MGDKAAARRRARMDEALERRPVVSRETGARQAPRRAQFDVAEEDNSLSTADGAIAPGPAPAHARPLSGANTFFAGDADSDAPSGGATAFRQATPSDDQSTTSVSRETLPKPRSPRIMAVANQKGGVGKTTSTVNIATALAAGGLSVLVIDVDPQGNASTALGVDHDSGTPGTYEVLLEGDPIARHVVASDEAPNLWVLPATIDLAGSEIQLVSMVSRETRLRRAVDKLLQTHQVDYIFFDCPPSLGLLTLNALVAADELMLPIQCEYYALEGVTQLMNTIGLVTAELNEGLAVSTVLMTMFDRRTNLSQEVVQEVRQHFPDITLNTVIPRSVRIAEAPSYNQSVITYDPRSAGARAYIEAAREIAERGAKEQA